jgi:thiol-disulfide isomerase/thioredoxin
MYISFALALLLLIPNSAVAANQPKFTKPSEAYTFVRRPIEQWQATVHAGKGPKTSEPAMGEVHQRARTWCPAFAVEEQSGEELYFLALLCRDALDRQRARSAIEQYLAQRQPHGPEARLLLAALENSPSELDKSWQTLRTVLQQDPIGIHQKAVIDSVIEDEAEKDDAKALSWAKERYSLLVDRATNPTQNTTTVSYEWVVFAGTDLMHRYYLSGKNDEAQRVLAELNGFKEAHQSDIGPLSSESLRWANLEMHDAPPIPIQKLLGGEPVSELIQKDRVEVISFFSLGCEPCMRELRALNDLQKRYQRKNVLVADVTSDKANSFLDPPTQSKIEAALNRTRRKKAPDLSVVVTSDEALADYRVVAFPVVAVIDKRGRVRYMGSETDFDEDEPVSRLINRLSEE